MADHVYFVLSSPPEGVSDGEYDRWYDGHAREILTLPGWVAAERFALDFIRSSPSGPAPYRFYTRYEIEGDFDTAMRELREAVDSGRMPFPDWFASVRSAGWECVQIGERIEAGAEGP